ncbi:helix-turn-helix domain-containing protein [Nocardia asteroides]|uniref:AraC-like ligand-binding domain-containing protein n=1 Tax=Nocardia asteroides TaxID=1824 RepID=UPI001E3F4DF7|nr:helix-turn-helix domain-containing protein [Nocardia asteroides]UGT53342.1 helix-turn-helix domain-containing protein [Nocardia asteroides]
MGDSDNASVTHLDSSPDAVSIDLRAGPAMAPDEAFGQWESVLSTGFVPVEIAPAGECAFAAHLDQVAIGGTELSIATSTGQDIRRTRSAIAASDGEFMLVSIHTHGEGQVQQDDRTGRMGPGDMIFYDSTRPFRMTVDMPATQVVVQVPLETIRTILGTRDLPVATAKTLPAAGAGGVVSEFFCNLARLHQRKPAEAQVLGQCAAPLFASALLLADGLVPTGPAAAAVKREQVLHFLRRHCTDPALTVDQIARACFVSRRSLYRLFDSSHGLVAVIRDMRLEQARSMMLYQPYRSTAAIAAACGFASERQFYRAFRADTGLTPGEFRHAQA